jgi:peptidoglycan hydrolase-like protein with peptidoglycan-binding domain
MYDIRALTWALAFFNPTGAITRNSQKQKEKRKMKRSLTILVTLLVAFSITAMAQNSNSSKANANTAAKTANANTKKRGPVFRANKDQIKQAQAILKQRNFYAGEQTGKLDDDTRAGLKKYQQAEGIKVTGTLNKVTLEKMNITLTDKQKAM